MSGGLKPMCPKRSELEAETVQEIADQNGHKTVHTVVLDKIDRSMSNNLHLIDFTVALSVTLLKKTSLKLIKLLCQR